MDKKELCKEHIWENLGFESYARDNQKVEAVAAIFCKKCGMFRTKILTFHREILPDRKL